MQYGRFAGLSRMPTGRGTVFSSPLPVSHRLGMLSSNSPHLHHGGRWAPVRHRLNPQRYFFFALALALALG
jgi:hypothetical protein